MAVSFKRIIADTLLKLSEDHPLNKISVSQIIKESGISRQTFYNHFRDKNDLIYWIFRKTLAGENELMKAYGLYAYLTKLYSEAQVYRKFLAEACKQEGQGSLTYMICRQTYKYYRHYIVVNYGEKEINEELEFALMFNAYGASYQYVRWAEEGMPGEASRQAYLAIKCMPLIMKKYMPVNLDDFK